MDNNDNKIQIAVIIKIKFVEFVVCFFFFRFISLVQFIYKKLISRNTLKESPIAKRTTYTHTQPTTTRKMPSPTSNAALTTTSSLTTLSTAAMLNDEVPGMFALCVRVDGSHSI